MVGLTPLRRQCILTSVFLVAGAGCEGAHKQKSSTEFTGRQVMHIFSDHETKESKQEVHTVHDLTWARPTPIVRRLSRICIVHGTLRRPWFDVAWTTRQNQGCRHAGDEACEDVYTSMRHLFTYGAGTEN